jgi:hypothetical protein
MDGLSESRGGPIRRHRRGGTLRSSATEAVSFPHGWTEDGVMVEAAFTGAHLLYLAAAPAV